MSQGGGASFGEGVAGLAWRGAAQRRGEGALRAVLV
jgi:hypothetical protein